MEDTEDFVQADNRNLPDVNILMLIEFMLENNKYSTAEIKIAKELVKSKEIYVDTAVGYVELQRQANICTLKCKLMSERIVEVNLYEITAVIDESTETIFRLECNRCEGCRHSIYFALWLIKRSCESLEEYVSYYTPPIFAEVDKKGFITAKELAESYTSGEDSCTDDENKLYIKEEDHIKTEPLPENTNLLKDFLKECKRRKIRSRLLDYYNSKSDNDDEN